MIKKWKQIRGHNGRYEISHTGEIRTITSGKIHRQFKITHGYIGCTLSGKQYIVHRLLANAFIGNTDGKEINHINRIKSDNRLENIEIVSRKENMNHYFSSLNKHSCLQCKREFRTRKQEPKACGKCHSRKWNLEPITQKCLKCGRVWKKISTNMATTQCRGCKTSLWNTERLPTRMGRPKTKVP